MDKFRATSDDLMSRTEFQTRLELEVNYNEVKMGFQHSGKIFTEKDVASKQRCYIRFFQGLTFL